MILGQNTVNNMDNLIPLIKEKIKEVAFKKVNEEDELFESGVLTSILIVELATALEDELGISIPFTEVTTENFRTVLTIQHFLIAKKNNAA